MIDMKCGDMSHGNKPLFDLGVGGFNTFKIDGFDVDKLDSGCLDVVKESLMDLATDLGAKAIKSVPSKTWRSLGCSFFISKHTLYKVALISFSALVLKTSVYGSIQALQM